MSGELSKRAGARWQVASQAVVSRSFPRQSSERSIGSLVSLPEFVRELLRRRSLRLHVENVQDAEATPAPIRRKTSVAEVAELKGKKHAEMIERFQIRQLNQTPGVSMRGGDDQIGGVDQGHAPDQEGISSHDRSQRPPALPALQLSEISRQPAPLTGERDQGTHVSIHATQRSYQEEASSTPSRQHLPPRTRLTIAWRQLMKNLRTPMSPLSTIFQCRQVFMIIALIIHLVYFPLSVAFWGNEDDYETSMLIAFAETAFIIDCLLTFNTSFTNRHGILITSRRAITRHYLTGWFLPDLLSSLPIELTRMLRESDTERGDTSWKTVAYDLCFHSTRAAHTISLLRFLWIHKVDRSDRGILAWLFYSRYSHLVRIVSIIFVIILVSHYMACFWKLLQPTEGESSLTTDAVQAYVSHFYDVLQLLQGQGIETKSIEQNIFAALLVLIGSVALATVFGHVAMLVSNFNANTTSYQRKMESMFATMNKLQLPAPLRERIRQYYEHLWREYESLDGEIVRFSKELSHTLELEVVLFKYMDLVMHVPFWGDASPDFQKQLMLHLDVRVYLPDDFIIRRGEVGDEFYMINRGICELELGSDSFECTIKPLEEEIGLDESGDDDDWKSRQSTDSNWVNPLTARYKAKTARGPLSARSTRGPLTARTARGGPLTGRAAAIERGASARFGVISRGRKLTHNLRRGQTFGEMALIMNYERTADARALTYVEMCVLKREDFQEILVKHPADRYSVLFNILSKTMINNEATRVACPLKQTVESVFHADKADGAEPEPISAEKAAQYLTRAINQDLDDSSICCGIGPSLRDRLVKHRDKEKDRRDSARSQTEHSNVSQPSSSSPSVESSGFVMSKLETTQARIKVLEQTQQEMLALARGMQQEMQEVRNMHAQVLQLSQSFAFGNGGPIASPLSRRLSRSKSGHLMRRNNGLQPTPEQEQGEQQ